MYAKVVTRVARCHKAKGLPGNPQMLTCRNKCDETWTKLFIILLNELLGKMGGLKLLYKMFTLSE
jgi:hypothetical protein